MKLKFRSRHHLGLIVIAFAAAGLSPLGSPSAQAAGLNWDGGDATFNGTYGGNGTWDTGTLNWSNVSADQAWTTNTITGDTALFAGTAGTVTLGSSINALGLQFTTTGYTATLGGNTLTLGTGGIDASSLSSGTTTINGSGTLAVGASQSWNVGSGATLAVASKLSIGSGSTLTKSGSGTLALSSYLDGSGTLTLEAGTTTLQTTTLNVSNVGFYNSFTGTINVGSGTTLGFNSPNSANGADYYYNLSNAALAFSGGTTQWNAANGSATNNPGVAYINFGSISGTTGTLAGSSGGSANTKITRYIVGTLNTSTTFGGTIATSNYGTALTKAGTGTLTLTGTNSYAGSAAFGTFGAIPATTIRGGTLQVGDGTSGSLASTGALTFLDAGTFNYQGKTAGSAQSLGALTFSQGAGTVRSTYGTGGNTSLTFSNVVARTAGATANFVVSGGANGSTNKIVFTQVAGATPTTGALLDKGYFFGGDSYAAYDTGGFVRAYGSGDTNYVTASGSNAIASTSANNVALTGNVDTQASAAINTLNMGAKTLALNTGAAFQTNGILVSGNSASTISGGTSLAATTGDAELVIRVNGSSDALNIGTPIIANGTNALTKTGAGTLTLSATGNTYSGTTYVDEGILAISGSNTGNGAYIVNNTGTLNVSGTLTSTGLMTVANGSGNGTVNVNSGANVTIGGLNISNSGTGYDTGTGTVNVNGGTLTSTQDVTVGLGGAQTGKLVINSGTVNIGTTAEKWLKIGQFDTVNGEIDINGGTLNLNTNTDIRFSVNNGGGINVINQNDGTVASYSGNQTGLGSGNVLDLQYASSTTANNTYNLNGGTLNISQVLSTATTGTRTFNFNGGTLKNTAASTTFFNLGSGTTRANVRNGGAIIDTTNGNITIAQALLHSNVSGDNATDGGLTKSGAGTLTLSGANTYTGNTTIKAGTLTLDSTGTIANSANIVVGDTGSSGTVLDLTAKSAFSFVSGQKVTGIGDINIGSTKTITIASGATLAPSVQANGNKLDVDGKLDFVSGSIFEWDLNATNGSDPGVVPNSGNYGQLAATGTASGTAVFNIVLGSNSYSDAFWNTNKSWTNIFSASGLTDLNTLFTTFSGSGLTATGSGATAIATADGQGYFSFSGTSLNWSAVPEPTTALAGLLIGAGLLRRRRRS